MTIKEFYNKVKKTGALAVAGLSALTGVGCASRANYVAPYVGVKTQLQSKEDIGPIMTYGVRAGSSKDNEGFYVKAEYFETHETKTNAQLDSTVYKLGAGIERTKEYPRWRLTGRLGANLQREHNTGFVGPMPINENETVFGLDAGASLEKRLGKKLSFFVGADVGYNIGSDMSNTTTEATGSVGFRADF
ncbi:hypothetical protein DRN73_03770 [Candidatus Pacearchaeota archaeon]|nr:MAG: hypothetical protein DRN73_03770 [Candidatus Pacearchaeota archaeon]